jgi:glycosyltransferase involved in cell wall biosynthesis
MPIRNEDKSIAKTLGAVLQQDYPHDRIEVLIADGRSIDGTRSVVERIRLEHPSSRILLVDNPGVIVARGLNLAIRESSGEVILRVDGHTEIPSDYIRQCVAFLLKTGADNVGGRTIARGVGLFGEAVALAVSSVFGAGDARFRYSEKEESADTVHPGAWRREIFDQIGLFDEEMVRDQDCEFNYRLRKQGGRILLSPLIRCTYTPRSTAVGLCRQYFQYGYWKVRVLQKHPGQMRWRQFVPPIFTVAGLISIVAALVWPVEGRILLWALAGCYLSASLLASILVGRRAGPRHIVLLPFVYAVLHLSYGSGFLVGLVRFANRWAVRSSAHGTDRRLQQAET